jgi:hypothetical protein
MIVTVTLSSPFNSLKLNKPWKFVSASGLELTYVSMLSSLPSSLVFSLVWIWDLIKCAMATCVKHLPRFDHAWLSFTGVSVSPTSLAYMLGIRFFRILTGTGVVSTSGIGGSYRSYTRLTIPSIAFIASSALVLVCWEWRCYFSSQIYAFRFLRALILIA